jgi:hypothetical protein
MANLKKPNLPAGLWHSSLDRMADSHPGLQAPAYVGYTRESSLLKMASSL